MDLNLTPGTWRVFTDFKATGADALTLGADLAVDGDYQPASPAAENRTATVGDYEVTLEGDLTAGADAKPHAHRQQGRRTGHRSGALPGRLRPPGRAARR
ncbi:hypothetical protein [Nocardioides convexus]|uniref:hypothetical protein n=1 Tax=Nocardioides convexus TaxID=2712224 RepID=UPI002418601D|nr:hypothetical protein [Nocardioides convexus]